MPAARGTRWTHPLGCTGSGTWWCGTVPRLARRPRDLTPRPHAPPLLTPFQLLARRGGAGSRPAKSRRSPRKLRRTGGQGGGAWSTGSARAAHREHVCRALRPRGPVPPPLRYRQRGGRADLTRGARARQLRWTANAPLIWETSRLLRERVALRLELVRDQLGVLAIAGEELIVCPQLCHGTVLDDGNLRGVGDRAKAVRDEHHRVFASPDQRVERSLDLCFARRVE